MKEFTICYTLDNDIKKGKLIKGQDVKAEDVIQEVLKQMEHSKFVIVTDDEGDYLINSSLVRYIRIIEEKILVQL